MDITLFPIVGQVTEEKIEEAVKFAQAGYAGILLSYAQYGQLDELMNTGRPLLEHKNIERLGGIRIFVISGADSVVRNAYKVIEDHQGK